MTISVPSLTDQKFAQASGSSEVQMVGRLVEQKGLRPAEERLREQDADFLGRPAAPPSSACGARRGCRAPAAESPRGSRFVPILVTDDAFELAEAHAFGVGHVCSSVELLALLERAPEAVIAHDDRIQDAELIERELT